MKTKNEKIRLLAIAVPILLLLASVFVNTRMVHALTKGNNHAGIINSSTTVSCFKLSFKGTINYDYINEVLKLVNKNRKEHGRKALVLDEALTKAAIQRAYESAMYFSHERPNGTSCFTAIRSKYGAVGENLAAGYTSPSKVMKGWMHSEGHRHNILTEYYESIGIGAVQVNGRIYWVQVFTDESAKPFTKSGSVVATKSVSILPSRTKYSVHLDTSMKVGAQQTLQIYNNSIKVNLHNAQFRSSSAAVKIKGNTITAVKAGTAKITLVVGSYKKVIGTIKIKDDSFTHLKPVIKLKAGSKNITVSWKKVSGASGYNIYRATSKNGTYKKVATITKGSKVSHKNTGLKKQKRYYYKVRAYRKVNGNMVYSKSSAIISARTK